MDEVDVRELIQSWENLYLLVNVISDYPEYLDLIVDRAFNDSQPENWRAAWMIDKIHERHPDMVVPYLPAITEFLFTTQSQGKKRHFLKLISLHPIDNEHVGLLLDFCLDLFADGKEPVSVKCHAMQVLYNIALEEPEFANEFAQLIENEIEYHTTPGISSRGKKLLQKLYKLKEKEARRSS
jgi:hypothetical protein